MFFNFFAAEGLFSLALDWSNPPNPVLSGKLLIGRGQAACPASRTVPFWKLLSLRPSDEHVSILDKLAYRSGCPPGQGGGHVAQPVAYSPGGMFSCGLCRLGLRRRVC